MPTTIKYIGVADSYAELPVTGKQSVWQVGQQEERESEEAALLMATGLFSTPSVPVTASTNPLTGRIKNSAGNQLGQLHPAIEAMRMHVAGRLPISYDLIVGAPTIATGVANAASTISGAVNITFTSPLIAESTRCETGASYPASQFRFPRNIDGQAANASAAFTTGLAGSWSIVTDSADVEYRVKGDGFVTNGRVWVTENGTRKMAGALPQLPGDGSLYWVKIAFGSASYRKVEIEMSGGYFGGFNVTSTANVGQALLRGPHVMVLGDSFTEGTGAARYTDSYAARLMRNLGIEKFTISGIGATGYGATNGGAKKSLALRCQNDVIGLAPDIVIHCNGINDTLSEVATNAPVIFDAITAALPNTAQIVFAPFNPRSLDVEARSAALQAMCAARGLLFIDSVSQLELTGTGYLNAKVGNGNCDIVIGGTNGSDPTHPTQYGHSYIADWRTAQVIKAIEP